MNKRDRRAKRKKENRKKRRIGEKKSKAERKKSKLRTNNRARGSIFCARSVAENAVSFESQNRHLSRSLFSRMVPRLLAARSFNRIEEFN